MNTNASKVIILLLVIAVIALSISVYFLAQNRQNNSPDVSKTTDSEVIPTTKRTVEGMTDREYINQSISYCTSEKEVAVYALQSKNAGIPKEALIKEAEMSLKRESVGNEEEFRENMFNIVSFVYDSEDVAGAEVRKKYGSQEGVQIHADDISNQVFLKCMNRYGHFEGYDLQ